jgi:exosome complex component CSL4
MVGRVEINKKDRIISVVPVTSTPPIPKIGDIVVGRITDVRQTLALIEIACIKGKGDRALASSKEGVIHISNVRESYVTDLTREFKYLDIVKARVIDARALRLSTVDRNLGVIKAFCPICKVGLNKKYKALECPKCRRIEIRKISEDYGSGMI